MAVLAGGLACSAMGALSPCSEQMAGPTPEESIRVANEMARNLLSRTSEPLQEKCLHPALGRWDRARAETWMVTGVPSTVRLMTERGPFRIYLRTQKEHDDSVALQSLLSAGASYVVKSPRLWQRYHTDLTGIFLTHPNVPPEHIGLGREATHFIDMLLPEGVPLLWLEREIFLIPLPPRISEWRVKGGEPDNPHYRIPMEIVVHGPLGPALTAEFQTTRPFIH